MGPARPATCPCRGSPAPGGSGKSSLTDEIVRRLRRDSEDKIRVAVLAIDPTRRRGGGALLGDRIRMNTIDPDVVFFRSMATRGAPSVPALPGRRGVCVQGGRLRPGDRGNARHWPR